MRLYNIMDLLIDISLQTESSNEFVIVKLYTVYHYLVVLSIKGTVARDFRPPLFSIKRTYLGP
jgi:hypothetical protein